MARRLFNGRRFSENGWPYVDEGSCTWVKVPGADVTLQIQNGPPLQLLRAWAADWNAYIEPLRDADSACWTPGNSVATSNHPGGTAIDLNWNSHPFQKRGSLNAAQMATLAEMENFYEGNVFWAGRWDSPADEMHSQVGYNTYDQNADAPFPKVLDFINRKIRADGYSTFRRGEAPSVDAAQVLAQATGLSLERAAEILPTMVDGLKQADCTNANRIAMFIAQTGHESANFARTEEFASGAAYEGRCSDLGNCLPGDGVRFKGRTWIQITGRHNYSQFSQWAYSFGLIGDPAYFVDHPVELQDLKWAGIGAAWYWTVARSDINALSDAGDLVTVTKRINGGTNGLDTPGGRRDRYNRALALGDQLLTLTTGEDWLNMPSNQEKLDFIYDELQKSGPSRSFLAPDAKKLDTLLGFLYNTDGNAWNGLNVWAYLFGVPYAVEAVERVASEGVHPDSYAADNPFVAEFGEDFCKGLVEFKAKLLAALKPSA